jgi:hypothetical protein
MSDRQKMTDIEQLAKMAARLAGRDPDEYLKVELANVVAFEGLMWRYPDFLNRAEAAYEMLVSYPIPAAELRHSHNAFKKTG